MPRHTYGDRSRARNGKKTGRGRPKIGGRESFKEFDYDNLAEFVHERALLAEVRRRPGLLHLSAYDEDAIAAADRAVSLVLGIGGAHVQGDDDGAACP